MYILKRVAVPENGASYYEGANVTFRVRDHVNIHELMQEIRAFLLAVGYAPETVDTYIEAE